MANKDIPRTEESQAKDPTGKGKNKKVKKKKSKYKKILKGTFLTILITGLLAAVVLFGYIFAIIKSTPELDVNKVLSLSEPSQLFDDDGEFIDNLPTDQNREIIEYEEIPKVLKDAYIAIEDERFETHIGIDVKRTIGSAIKSAIFYVTGDGMVQGGSTLTQQLIKNTLLTNEVRIERKIKEIYLAISLENKLSKEEILKAYLNTIPLGSNVYGVEAASEYFFEKTAMELTLPEAAFIAGLTQAPTDYTPYYISIDDPTTIKLVEDPTLYLDRTKTVLMKMRDLGKITSEEYAEAYDFTDKNSFEFSQKVNNSYKIAYEWFVYPALDQVRKDLKEVYKYTDEEVDKLFANGGLKIHTTMNRKIQDSTQAVLDNRDNFAYIDAWANPEVLDENGTPKLQASATVVDYRTGQVKALVGGRGEQPALSTNRAYDRLRSIGSTTKPITVYAPALEEGVITAATAIYDAGLSPEIRSVYGTDLNNWDYKSSGIITPREGIALSKNTTAVTVGYKLGVDNSVSYGEKLGLVYSDASKGLSTTSLGEFTADPTDPDGGNTFILAGAFGTFGNNGLYTEPALYTKVEDSTGKVILEKTPKQTQVFSPQTAYIMRDLLKGPITFDGSSAKLSSGMPVIGKTGTTNYVTDFLFAGLTPYYSGSVWIGYDDNSKVGGASYSGSAANLWGLIMAPIHEGLEYKEFDGNPGGVVSVAVCQDSGLLPGEYCIHDQRGSRVRSELFISGTQPTRTCDVHVKAKVNKENNKLATDDTPLRLVEEKVFVKVANPNRYAADYQYTLPTEKDDTKAKSFKLSDLNIIAGANVDDAIKALKDTGVTLEIVNPNAATRIIKSLSANSVKQGDKVKVELENEIAQPEIPLPEDPTPTVPAVEIENE